eukprot:s162_g1.t1
MGLAVDIRTIAAEASWTYLQLRDTHPVYTTAPGGLKIVEWRPGAPSLANFIVDSLACDDENLFWKLNRADDCQGIATAFLSICACLAKRGLTLVFDGTPVANFYAVNGPINSTSVNETHISLDDPKTQKTYTLDLLTTLRKRKQLASLPTSLRRLFEDPRYAISEAEITNAEKVAKYLEIPEDRYVMHWWGCFELEDQRMVHIDLCGPAYGLFDYETTIAGNRAPVFAVVTEQLFLKPHPNQKDYAHKFHMTPCGKKNPARCTRLPAAFPPFAQEKINLEVTPVNVMQEKLGCPQRLQEELPATLVRKAISGSLEHGQARTLEVRLQHIVKRPGLDGCQARIICIVDDRVGVELESGEKIQVLPDKLTSVGPFRSQLMTLEEMTGSLKDEEQRHLDQMLEPGDTVSFQGLSRSGYLNGCEGIIVEGKPADLSGAVRYVVKVKSSGELKHVRRKNLHLQQKKVLSQSEEAHIQAINQYLTQDPLGAIFFQRVITAGSFGLTNMTDPELLPALEKLVKMKMPEIWLSSPPMQRKWEAAVRLSKREHFQDFRRQVLQHFRSGIRPDELTELLENHPGFADLYAECLSQGFLSQRSE